MVNRFLLDSNIFILLFNNRLSENLPEGEIACSIITEMELLSFPRLSVQEEKRSDVDNVVTLPRRLA